MENIQLHNGDCLEVLKTLADNSVDSIVTDPPYGISFMNKKWDYDVPTVDIWKECIRVLKPGGHILVACGTKTQHRMAINIEDAGFEIRDIIAWVYGSGFPKSLNVGKNIDNLQGNERKFVSKNPANRPYCYNKGETSTGWKSLPRPDKTQGETEWEGWGTALKPSMELWTLARKPLEEKTVAENVLKYGTGAINIDGCRVEYSGYVDPRTFGGSWKTDKGGKKVYDGGYAGDDLTVNQNGRFPANLIHDGSDEVMDEFKKAPFVQPVGSAKKTTHNDGMFGIGTPGRIYQNETDTTPARFFYCAKASTKERTSGNITNNHPTVKPVSLMKYLVRLITPPNGIILDPYMGSGTTGIGAKLEGFGFIGIERDAEYYKISEARITNYTEDTKKVNKTKKDDMPKEAVKIKNKFLKETVNAN